MIYAGALLANSPGGDNWNGTNETHENQLLEVDYPDGQTAGSNPPVAGDIVIDESSQVWEIFGTPVSQGGNVWQVALKGLDPIPDENIIPSSDTYKGIVFTPTSIGLNEYLPQGKVDRDVMIRALTYNMKSQIPTQLSDKISKTDTNEQTLAGPLKGA